MIHRKHFSAPLLSTAILVIGLGLSSSSNAGARGLHAARSRA